MLEKKIRELKKEYNTISVPVKAAFWFMVCNIVQKGISMITIPLFTRLLTTEEYGLFSVYQSWYMIIGIFASLNLQDAAFNTGMVKFSDDKDDFIMSLQSLTTILTLFLLLLYLGGMDFWNEIFELPTILVLTMFVELLFIPAYSFWSARQKFEYKYIALIFSTLFIAIMCPAVAAIAILCSSHRGEARIISFTLVQAAVGLGFYVLNIHRGKKMVNIKYWRYALGFSIPLIPHYLSMTVLQQSDRIMIGKLIGNGEAAIYSIAYNVSQLMLLVTKAINNSFIPYTYHSLQDKKYKELREKSKLLLILVAGMLILLMMIGPEVIKIFATEEYYAAIWIIPPVSLSVFFLFLYPMFSNVEFYYEKNSVAMAASLIGAIANIILNYIFIPLYGYVAAGYTTVFCYMIFAIMHYWGMKRVLKQQGILEHVYDARFIIALSTLMFLLMIGVLLVYPYTVVRYAIVFAIGVCCIIFRNRLCELIKGFKK